MASSQEFAAHYEGSLVGDRACIMHSHDALRDGTVQLQALNFGSLISWRTISDLASGTRAILCHLEALAPQEVGSIEALLNRLPGARSVYDREFHGVAQMIALALRVLDARVRSLVSEGADEDLKNAVCQIPVQVKRWTSLVLLDADDAPKNRWFVIPMFGPAWLLQETQAELVAAVTAMQESGMVSYFRREVASGRSHPSTEVDTIGQLVVNGDETGVFVSSDGPLVDYLSLTSKRQKPRRTRTTKQGRPRRTRTTGRPKPRSIAVP